MWRGRSILSYLQLLVAATVLPFVGMLAYGYYYELRGEAAEARTAVRSLAEMAAGQASEFVTQSRRYLEVMARRPIRDRAEVGRCGQDAFGDFQELHPEFASLMLVDARGKVVCSNVSAPLTDVAVADQEWFQAIRDGQAFTIGRPLVSPFTGRWVVVLAHAVYGKNSQFEGAVALSIDLALYRPLPAGHAAPPGIAVTLLTADGTIVARSGDAEAWLGRNIGGNEMGAHVLAREFSEEEYADVDGVRRLCGFSPVDGVGWVAAAGIPTEVAYAEVRAYMVKGSVVLVAAAALAVSLALIIGRVVVTPMRRLVNAVRALADGQPETRLMPDGPREMIEVGEQFNRMLDVRARTEIALGESQKRLQALFDHMRDGMLLVDDNAAHVDANPALCALLGYTRDEMLQMALWDDVPPELRPQLGEMWERFLALGWLEGEFICQRKDGTRVEVDYLAAANFMPGLHLCSVRDITARRQAEAKLARYTEHLKSLSRRLVEVQEDERRHLSRELHDRTGQNLTAINLHLSMIREQVAPQALAIHARVEDAMTLVSATLEAVRDVMADLRPPVLDDYGLLAALRWYGDIFSRRTGLVVAVAGSDATPRLSKVAETALFRVAQEAFNNVAKHAASATRIDVALEHGAQHERLIVQDDGVGFDPASERQAGSGWGILSMEERSEAVGGVLHVHSVPGHGTRIVVEVPHAGA